MSNERDATSREEVFREIHAGKTRRKRKAIKVDLTGAAFGRLIVVRLHDFNKWNQRRWLCRCICGKEIIVPMGALRTGNTSSCGCLRSEMLRIPRGMQPQKSKNGYWESARNLPLSYYKSKAKKYDRTWSISDEEAYTIFTTPCHYCGEPPSNRAITKRARAIYIYSGIDRIDSSRGYEPGNVLACCGVCNVAKNDQSYEDFLKWIKRVHDHQASAIEALAKEAA